MQTDVHFSSAKTGGRDDWGTERALFDALNDEFHFDLDAAADSSNHLCAYWFGPGSPWAADALDPLVFWGPSDGGPDAEPVIAWLNPPYSLNAEFVAKALEMRRYHWAYTVVLLPARPDTRYFHDVIWQADEIVFLKGRLKFGGAKDAAPFPSMLAIFHDGCDFQTQVTSVWDWRREPFAARRAR